MGEGAERRIGEVRGGHGTSKIGGYALLFRVESTAGEMRMGASEFARKSHREIGSKTPMERSWFPNLDKSDLRLGSREGYLFPRTCTLDGYPCATFVLIKGLQG